MVHRTHLTAISYILLITLAPGNSRAEIRYALSERQQNTASTVACGTRSKPTLFSCARCSAPDCGCTAKGAGAGAGAGTGGPGSAPAPDFSDLAQASDYGDPMGSYSSAPYMIGDFFGAGLRSFINPQALPTGPDQNRNMGQGTIAIAGGDRQFKIVENMSVLPVDRCFFNYHRFANPIMGAAGNPFDLNRFTFGIERTHFDGMMSCELRIPFAAGLAPIQDVFVLPPGNNEATQFGNIAFVTKLLLIERESFALSAGVGTTAPTADDVAIVAAAQPVLTIKNESFLIQPFVGMLWRHTDDSWLQFFAQATFDANGNPINFDLLPDPGVLQDQSLLFLSASYGHWLFRDPGGSGLITGIAPIVEVHYTTTMQDADIAGDPAVAVVTNPFNRMDVLNITGALRLQLGSRWTVTASGVAPLRGNEENLFDSEFALQVVRTH